MICRRCGLCCWNGFSGRYAWKESNRAMDVTDKMKINKFHCEMLGNGFCNLEKVFGYDAKPQGCKDYFCHKVK